MGIFGSSKPNVKKMLKKRDYKAMTEALKHKGEDAIYAFVKIGESAVNPLIQILEGDDNYVRINAARALGEIGDKRAIKPLIQALEDDYVRKDAADALVKIGEPAVKPLIQIFESGNKYVRCCVVNALAEIGDKRAVKPFIQALESIDENISVLAAIALGEIGDKRAIKPLTRKLNSMYLVVRINAEEALRKIRG